MIMGWCVGYDLQPPQEMAAVRAAHHSRHLDVIHAFWIPRLAGKIDAVPGHVNLLRIQADVPGHYQGLCNQFCGRGHPGMRFDVIVHPAADFHTAIAKPDAAGKVKQ